MSVSYKKSYRHQKRPWAEDKSLICQLWQDKPRRKDWLSYILRISPLSTSLDRSHKGGYNRKTNSSDIQTTCLYSSHSQNACKSTLRTEVMHISKSKLRQRERLFTATIKYGLQVQLSWVARKHFPCLPQSLTIYQLDLTLTVSVCVQRHSVVCSRSCEHLRSITCLTSDP